MTKYHPLYSKPNEVKKELMPKYFPNYKVDIPKKDRYTWLDIGCAPKENGSPGLNELKKLLPDFFSFDGCDISFPLYKLEQSRKNNYEIKISKYFEDFNTPKREVEINGILYHNSSKDPNFDVQNENFLKETKYDFISACMVLHQIYENEPREIMPFSSKTLVDTNGNSFEENARLPISRQQQEVIDRILDGLNPGGVLFATFNLWWGQYDNSQNKIPFSIEWHLENENLFDMLFMVQKSQDKFIVYDKAPILFQPNLQISYPSKIGEFINGSPNMSAKIFQHSGIQSYVNLTDKQKEALDELFIRADMLAQRYQGWKKGIWGRNMAVINAIKEQKNIPELFEIYLKNVPDDSMDKDTKKQIIKEARRI